ncbi:MAG: DUF1295 domain-containing protein [Hyphomicrobiaceae bacterium]
MTGDSVSWRQWLVAVLASAWALRLGSYIVASTLGSGDDPRCRNGGVKGPAAPRNMALFLQAQACYSQPYRTPSRDCGAPPRYPVVHRHLRGYTDGCFSVG